MDQDTSNLKQLLKALGVESANVAGESSTSKTKALTPADDSEVLEQHVPQGGGSYLPEVYDAQKDIGTRRENGALKLKRLRPFHKQVLALHLAAWPNEEIAKKLNRSPSWISSVINDPLSQEVLNNFEDLQEEEFKRLRLLANSALRDALLPHKNDSTRLRAARIFYQKDGEAKGEKGETAEDVMAKVLQNIEAENVQINFNLSKE